jgi:hypothetical protein
MIRDTSEWLLRVADWAPWVRRWRWDRILGVAVIISAGLMSTCCSSRYARWEVAGLLIPMSQTLPPAGEQLHLLPPHMIAGGSPMGTPCAIDEREFFLSHGFALPSGSLRESWVDEHALTDTSVQHDLTLLNDLVRYLDSDDAQRSLRLDAGASAQGAAPHRRLRVTPAAVSDEIRPWLHELVHSLEEVQLASVRVAPDGQRVSAMDGDAAWACRRDDFWHGTDAACQALTKLPLPRGELSRAIAALSQAVTTRNAPIMVPCLRQALSLLQVDAQSTSPSLTAREHWQLADGLSAVFKLWIDAQQQLTAHQAIPTLVYAPAVLAP